MGPMSERGISRRGLLAGALGAVGAVALERSGLVSARAQESYKTTKPETPLRPLVDQEPLAISDYTPWSFRQVGTNRMIGAVTTSPEEVHVTSVFLDDSGNLAAESKKIVPYDKNQVYLAQSDADPKKIVVVGGNGGISYTVDGGATPWKEINIPFGLLDAQVTPDNNYAWLSKFDSQQKKNSFLRLSLSDGSLKEYPIEGIGVWQGIALTSPLRSAGPDQLTNYARIYMSGHAKVFYGPDKVTFQDINRSQENDLNDVNVVQFFYQGNNIVWVMGSDATPPDNPKQGTEILFATKNDSSPAQEIIVKKDSLFPEGGIHIGAAWPDIALGVGCMGVSIQEFPTNIKRPFVVEFDFSDPSKQRLISPNTLPTSGEVESIGLLQNSNGIKRWVLSIHQYGTSGTGNGLYVLNANNVWEKLSITVPSKPLRSTIFIPGIRR